METIQGTTAGSTSTPFSIDDILKDKIESSGDKLQSPSSRVPNIGLKFPPQIPLPATGGRYPNYIFSHLNDLNSSGSLQNFLLTKGESSSLENEPKSLGTPGKKVKLYVLICHF